MKECKEYGHVAQQQEGCRQQDDVMKLCIEQYIFMYM